MNFIASASIFLCILGIGNSLECYTCNVTTKKGEDAHCKGQQSLKTCTNPAVCLTATYSNKDKFSSDKVFTTIKSCYLKGLGQECTTFLTAIKMSNPMSIIEFTENCKICEDNGCNHASAVTLPMFLLGISLLLSKV